MKRTKRFLTMALACVMLLGAALAFSPAPNTGAAAKDPTMSGKHCPNSTCGAYLWDYGDHYYCRYCGYSEKK